MHRTMSAMHRSDLDNGTIPRGPGGHGSGPTRARAVVIGAGIAGLLSARVLSNHYAWVGIVERDALPAVPTARRGTPQGRHGHLLLMQGRRILESLFPGIHQELLGLGAIPLDWNTDVHWLGPAGWMARPDTDGDFSTWATSRDLLEFVLRRRLLSHGQIEVLDLHKAVGLEIDERAGRVRGVQILSGDHCATSVSLVHSVPADLVVDASGRSSLAPEWLDTLGYGRPQESEVNAFLGYASRLYRRQHDEVTSGWKMLIVSSSPPACSRFGAIFPIEDDRWIVSLMGAGRDYPPADEIGFLNFARSLRFSGVYEAMLGAEPVSPIYSYRRTENRFRHYERMNRWPDGFIVVGDAVCGFNPVYGQGMTVAAIAAQLLDSHLRARTARYAFNRSFRHELAMICNRAWTMATGADFAYPITEGGIRHWHTRWVQAYLDQVLALSTEHPDVYCRFLRVMHMVAGPAILFTPSVAARVMSRLVGQLLH